MTVNVTPPIDIGYRPGLLDLESCLLYNYRKSALEIRHMMVEFSIFHDLLAHGTKLEMVITDTNGMIEMVPIVGDETLVMKFKTPTSPFSVLYVFNVYKINKRKHDAQRSDTYVLHGISQEIINNERKSVSQAFYDLKASDVVSAIYENYLKPTESDFGVVMKNVDLDIDETKDLKAWTIPHQKPFEAIEYLAQEGESSSAKASNYVFYETPARDLLKKDNKPVAKKWNFKTLDSLLIQDVKEKNTFYYAHHNVEVVQRPANNGERWERARVENVDDPGETAPGQAIYAYQKIIDIEFRSQFDTLRNLEKGLYYHKVEIIDPLIKHFTTDEFQYDSDFNSFNHIEDQKIYTGRSLYAVESDTPKKFMMVSNYPDIYEQNAYIQKGRSQDLQVKYPRVFHQFAKFDIASSAQLSNMVIEITIPGNIDLDIGEMIKIELPQSSGNQEFLQRINILFNAKWLITAIRHTYNKVQDEFFTVVELVNDTYKKGAVAELGTEGITT